MLFNSYIFILFFLPLALAGYFLLNYLNKMQWANIWLIAMSLWFYGYFNIYYLPIICFSILMNYLLSKVILKTEFVHKKLFTAIGISANIAIIFYFKYFDFFIENVNTLFGRSFELRHIVLPLGISFFTFQQISYLVDSYRGETKEYHFIEYALFVSFFPQLVAGPIVLHEEMIPQFRDISKRKYSSENMANGIYVFAIGLFKKVLIADIFGKAVTYGFETLDTLTSMELMLVSIFYTLQLYLDFSGYCDMAIGIGHMFNIELPLNFNSPYKATSIIEFWDRWHMSLTRFLRKYIYYLLGGSRKGRLRTYVNILIVFLISGIWHGANWTFIFWGVCHGIANCINRAGLKIWERINIVVRWIVTFGFVNCMWIFFRSDTIEQAWNMIRKIGHLDSFTIHEGLYSCFDLLEFKALEEQSRFLNFLSESIPGFHMWLYLLAVAVALWKLRDCAAVKFKTGICQAVLSVICLVWSIMSLEGVSVFLYFNF